jgi:hypothetical protein
MPAKRPLPTVALGATVGTALVAGLTACGTGSNTAHQPGAQAVISARPADAVGSMSPRPTSGSDLESLSSEEIMQRVRTAMATVTSLRLSGTLSRNGQSMSMDLAADNNGNCTGTVATADGGSVEIRHTGSQTWIKPDAAFWRHLAAQNGKPERGDRAAKLFQGRYLTGSPDDPGLKQITHSCDTVTHVAGALGKDGSPETKGPLTSVNGVPTVQLTGEDGSIGYIAAQGSPYVLRVRSTGTDPSQIDLTDYNKPVVVDAPPADQVIDISSFQQKLSV